MLTPSVYTRKSAPYYYEKYYNTAVPMASAVVTGPDLNGNGIPDSLEIGNVWVFSPRVRVLSPSRPLVSEPLAEPAYPIAADANKKFDRIDANGDGVITRSEYLFDKLDRNHDGVISRAEFERGFAPRRG